MKAYLVHPGQDFDFERPLPWNAEAISEDLALSPLLAAMGKGDHFVREVARKVILSGFENNLDTIRHRLDILDDCLKQTDAVRELYAIAVEAVEKQRKHYLGALAHYPDWVLRLSLELIESLLDTVRKLREVTDAQSQRFVSDGWTRFFIMVKEELNDSYFAEVRYHLAQLKFRKGVCISARLGKANKGSDYVLRRPPVEEGTWLTRLLNWQRPPYSFSLDPRDEGGARALSELQDRGISLGARAVAQSADHISSFFSMLRTELAFYIGCVNLHEELAGKGEPTCLPTPEAADEGKLSFQDLYDASLALGLDGSTVGNDVNADRQVLIMITGANQGGKSTFLRSVGLAQLMMQSGHVRSRQILHLKRLRRLLHTLQAGRGHRHEEREA